MRSEMKKIIVDMDGRLGNQMFQYAYALKLKKEIPESEIIINFYRISLYGDLAPNEQGWMNNLQYFHADYQLDQQKLSNFLIQYLSKRQYFWLRVTNRLLHHLSSFKRHSYFPFDKLPNFLKYYSRFLYRKGLLIYPSKIKDLNYEPQNETIYFIHILKMLVFLKECRLSYKQPFLQERDYLSKIKSFIEKFKKASRFVLQSAEEIISQLKIVSPFFNVMNLTSSKELKYLSQKSSIQFFSFFVMI